LVDMYFVLSNCHNKIPQTNWPNHRNLFSHSSAGCLSQYQGVSIVGSLRSLPGYEDGSLLAVFSHKREKVLVPLPLLIRTSVL
jgi:hypothetical protein